MNAVAMLDGFARGGREGARTVLRRFWQGVAEAAEGHWGGFPVGPLRQFLGDWGEGFNPFSYWNDILLRSVSPYDFNPMNYNPLRDLVAKLIDFDAVRSCQGVRLFVSATDVYTGRVRVFEREALTADHVMASACLPFLFQAVEIEGEAYWDGGYMGNPSLWPLFEGSDTDDTIIVQINPIEREFLPKTSRDILDRVNEITFNASLLRELRAVDFVNRLREDGRLNDTGYRRVLIHMIADPEGFALGSRLRVSHALLETLFARGRAAAESWIEAHFQAVGDRSTVDLRRLFQGDAPAESSLHAPALKAAAKKPPPCRASGSCD
jgi:NTE family protein